MWLFFRKSIWKLSGSGQSLWHSWLRGRFRYQRTQSSATFIKHIYCELFVEKTKIKKKSSGITHFKALQFVINQMIDGKKSIWFKTRLSQIKCHKLGSYFHPLDLLFGFDILVFSDLPSLSLFRRKQFCYHWGSNLSRVAPVISAVVTDTLTLTYLATPF